MDAHWPTRVPFHEVENNCGYHLFESDHEEEEEEATEKKEEDEPAKKKSAFHVRIHEKVQPMIGLINGVWLTAFAVPHISQEACVMSFPSWRTTPGPPARIRLWRTWRKRTRKWRRKKRKEQGKSCRNNRVREQSRICPLKTASKFWQKKCLMRWWQMFWQLGNIQICQKLTTWDLFPGINRSESSEDELDGSTEGDEVEEKGKKTRTTTT